MIKYISSDIKRRIFLDFSRLSESDFSALWVVPRFSTVENGLPKVHLTVQVFVGAVILLRC